MNHTFEEKRSSFGTAQMLGKTLSVGGTVLSDNLPAFGKSGRRYPSFTP